MLSLQKEVIIMWGNGCVLTTLLWWSQYTHVTIYHVVYLMLRQYYISDISQWIEGDYQLSNIIAS